MWTNLTWEKIPYFQAEFILIHRIPTERKGRDFVYEDERAGLGAHVAGVPGMLAKLGSQGGG